MRILLLTHHYTRVTQLGVDPLNHIIIDLQCYNVILFCCLNISLTLSYYAHPNSTEKYLMESSSVFQHNLCLLCLSQLYINI